MGHLLMTSTLQPVAPDLHSGSGSEFLYWFAWLGPAEPTTVFPLGPTRDELFYILSPFLCLVSLKSPRLTSARFLRTFWVGGSG